MNRLISTILIGLTSIATVAQTNYTRPKLVVGIVVDQLRTDYIEYLRDIFGDKGFIRLMKDGIYFRDVDFFDGTRDKVSSTAVIYTGATPSASGITASEVYDAASSKILPILHDSQAIGNFTTETLSPCNLLLSTISDEIMIDGIGLGAVYSVSTDPQQAIIMAGHAGNGAFWINNNTGKWSSSTYFKETPQVISQRNYKMSLTSRLDTMQWKPILPLDRYPGIPAQKRHYPFRYTFPTSDKNVYNMFSESALANEEVTTVAIDLLKSLHIGNRGDVIDMLNIGYSATPFKYVKDGDFRLELQDTYIRLDAQLSRLFDAIEQTVGLKNTLVFLSSTGYYDDATIDDPKYKVPSGDFSIKRALSLLNAYLSAKYGNENFIEAYHNSQIYLNHKTIDNCKLNISDLATDACNFLYKMSGVSKAFTLNNALSDEHKSLYVQPKWAGDIIFEISPGWNIVDDTRFPILKRPIRSSLVCSPAFILAPNITHEIISTSIDATMIAPTVCNILRIRSPNGAVSRPKVL